MVPVSGESAYRRASPLECSLTHNLRCLKHRISNSGRCLFALPCQSIMGDVMLRIITAAYLTAHLFSYAPTGQREKKFAYSVGQVAAMFPCIAYGFSAITVSHHNAMLFKLVLEENRCSRVV
ncbi:hypothetical protein F5Y05DRAFT_50649 [Hypoxylon sp. FL0543]|nr:hypothetical protein F5Y05DRAFT_50649 [Hypoxylon sp. FL0543]